MLTDLIQWLFQLQGFELILWCIALLFSLLFLIQTIISFFIGDADVDGFDEGHGGATSFFTVRNMISFFTMFGWSGLAAYKSGIPNAWVIVIAVASGTLMVALLYLIMKKASGMRQSGTLQVHNAVSQVGETYLRIPAGRSGLGKVVPPLKDMFDRAGIGLPEYLGTSAKEVKNEEGEKEKGLELLG